MKLIIKDIKLALATIGLCTLMIVVQGCEKGDGDLDYGFAYIYIPQATVSGGLNNHYPVPGGAGENTYNFKEENGKLNVILGVLRSGKIANAPGFTVDIATSSNLTEDAVDSGAIPNAMALPASLYEIPGNVTVDPGKNSTAFYLSININALMDGSYDGKNLVLAVGISNPTNFELSDENTSVVVVINVNDLREVLHLES